MGTKTGIEWTDSTWSPIRYRVKANAAEIAKAKGYDSLVTIAEKMAGRVGQHCEHVSPGCKNCYAETNNHRCLPANGTGLPYDRRSRELVEPFIDEKALLQPLKWKPVVEHEADCKRSFDAGNEYCGCTRPRRIFIENQSDLFGEWVTDEMLDRVFAVMALTPQHIYQVLTKRPERMLKYFAELRTNIDAVGRAVETCKFAHALLRRVPTSAEFDALASIGEKDGLSNVWLGVSAENQATADERIPLLLKTPAALRFVSCEPLLGPVEIARWFAAACGDAPWLDWVICGGESGPGARPMHPDWARGLRDQCTASGVPFFFKQWGAWTTYVDRAKDDPDYGLGYSRFLKSETFRVLNLAAGRGFHGERVHVMQRVGKKAAGSKLDGREWKEFPHA